VQDSNLRTGITYWLAEPRPACICVRFQATHPTLWSLVS
jgi:hypothetical protein